MAVTLEEQTQNELIRYVRERGLDFRPDDPVTAKLAGTMQMIGSMGGEIRRLERENSELKAEIARLKGR